MCEKKSHNPLSRLFKGRRKKDSGAAINDSNGSTSHATVAGLKESVIVPSLGTPRIAAEQLQPDSALGRDHGRHAQPLAVVHSTTGALEEPHEKPSQAHYEPAIVSEPITNKISENAKNSHRVHEDRSHGAYTQPGGTEDTADGVKVASTPTGLTEEGQSRQNYQSEEFHPRNDDKGIEESSLDKSPSAPRAVVDPPSEPQAVVNPPSVPQPTANPPSERQVVLNQAEGNFRIELPRQSQSAIEEESDEESRAEDERIAKDELRYNLQQSMKEFGIDAMKECLLDATLNKHITMESIKKTMPLAPNELLDFVLTSARKVFVIMLLVIGPNGPSGDFTSIMGSFKRHGAFDKSILPIDPMDEDCHFGTKTVICTAKCQELHVDKCYHIRLLNVLHHRPWSKSMRKGFYEEQWKVLMPKFGNSKFIREFGAREIPPITEKEPQVRGDGYFSLVHQAKILASHQEALQAVKLHPQICFDVKLTLKRMARSTYQSRSKKLDS
jgi:hypothetical protein